MEGGEEDTLHDCRLKVDGPKAINRAQMLGFKKYQKQVFCLTLRHKQKPVFAIRSLVPLSKSFWANLTPQKETRGSLRSAAQILQGGKTEAPHQPPACFPLFFPAWVHMYKTVVCIL